MVNNSPDPEEKQFDDDFFLSNNENDTANDLNSTYKINESDNEEKLNNFSNERPSSGLHSRKSSASSIEKISLQKSYPENSDTEDELKVSPKKSQEIDQSMQSKPNSGTAKSPASARFSNKDVQESRNSSRHSNYEKSNTNSRLSNISRHSVRKSSPDFSSDDRKVSAKTVHSSDDSQIVGDKHYDDGFSENDAAYSRPSSLKSTDHSDEESENEASSNKNVKHENSFSEKNAINKETKKAQPNQKVVRANKPPPKGRIAFVSSPRKPGGAAKGRGRGNLNNGKNPDKKSVVVDRVLSANRNKTRNLHNIIAQLQQEIKDLSSENRYLQRSAKLQDREIRKLDNAEAELPLLLKKHSNEINAIQERYRNMKEKAEQYRNSAKKQEEILLKTQESLKKYEAIVKDKKLDERAALQEKLKSMEKELEDKEKKISELTRMLAITKKSHIREIKETSEKYKKILDDLHRSENDCAELSRKLKEKEKLLELTNIYSLRVNRRNSKDEERGMIFSPTEPVPPAIKRYQEEQEQRHDESETSRESNAHVKDVSQRRPKKKNNAKLIVKEEFDHEKSDNESGNNLKYEIRKQESPDLYPGDKKIEEELEQRILEKKKIKKENDRKNEENLKLEQERIKEAKKLIFEESNEIKEKEQKKKEEKEKMDEENKYLLQKLKENEDLEKQRKKELLLARMKAIDSGKNSDDFKDESSIGLLAKPTDVKKKEKPIFLQSNSPNDKKYFNSSDKYLEGEHERPLNHQKPERRLSWDFKKTDENLHKGLPAHFDSDSPATRRRNVTEYTENNPVRGLHSDDDLFTNSDQRGNGKRHKINNGMREDSLEEFPKKTLNKNSPFDMFDDPFNAKKKNTYEKKQNLFNNSDEELNNYSGYQPTVSNKPLSRQQRQNANKLNSDRSDNFIANLEELILI